MRLRRQSTLPLPTLPLSTLPLATLPLAAIALALVTVATSCGSSEDKVGLIGDSITDLSRGPLTTALGTDRRVEIVGKFGARTDQVLEDVKVIAASEPSAAIINIGTNDALQQIPPATTAVNIQKILDELDGVGCRHLVRINEGITDKATGVSRSAEARAVNDQITALAEDNDVGIVEWNDTIAAHGGNDAVTYDTVHLSEAGILLMADAYRTALDDC